MDQQQHDFDWETHEQRMMNKFWTYFYRATSVCVIANAIIVGTIYKYSYHPNPLIASIQLLLPLFIWELMLIMSFCPTDVLEYYLAEMLIEENLDGLDMALVNLLPAQQRRYLRLVQPGGDLATSNSMTNTDANRTVDNTASDVFLTERQIPTPYQLTE